ncbi:hypothetical protein [Acinetobacter nectaris]|uniref:hypothetical protein n=1 Tax=Acinetobacter nectaris TaxID=1219382 RepID=UPI001F2D32C1|nr:hypothetical protein [Acinetobacter nectaris]MCF8998419.1 hypothetical protein [Acinetobacter nectaris]MCF9027537.1 hypothetical protein [Acinetobacter nectaris]
MQLNKNFLTSQTLGKYDAEIDALKNIVHYGIGLDRTDAAFDLTLDKWLGKIPYGSDTSEFSTRKRLILIQLRSSLMLSIASIFSCGLLALIVGTFTFFAAWYFAFALLLFLYFTHKSIQSFKRFKALYQAIKPLQQIIPNIEKPQTCINEAEIAQTFSKDRLKSRCIGIAIMTFTGYMCHSIYYSTNSKIPVLALLLPLGFMSGLGTFITGMNKPEFFHRHGYAQARWRDLPLVMKICIVIGGIASISSFAWAKGLLIL